MRLTSLYLLPFLLAFVAAMAAAAPKKFDIPAQQADLAVMQFSRQAGVEVLFSSDELKLVQCKAVVGEYEPADAIALLLQDTGFRAKLNRAGKFVVQRDRKQPLGSGEQSRSSAMAPDQNIAGTLAMGGEEIIRLEDYHVTPSRYGIGHDRISRQVSLTRKELSALPQLGEDVYRTITRIPGLTSNDMSARFWMRGAPNTQVLARLDGIDLIEPFHLKDYDGALSIVDIETIGSINMTTGGFTADYGDKLTGLLEMETQDDTTRKRRTTLGISLTNLRATSQGSFADGDGQWLAAVRNGYVKYALELGGTDINDAPTYYDFTTKLAYNLTPDQTVSFHLLHAGDKFDRTHEKYEPSLHSSYDSTFLWGRWRGRFGDRASSEGVVSFSRLGWERRGEGAFDLSLPLSLSDERDLKILGLRNDWMVNLTEHVLIRTGWEFKSGRAGYDYQLTHSLWNVVDGNLVALSRSVSADLDPKGEHAGGFVALRAQPWSSLIVEPGLRYDRDSWNHDAGWSPRLNASYALGRATLRGAWGIYQQTQGLHELSVQDGETEFSSSERAEQRVIGISYALDEGTQLRVEAYERLISKPRRHWENLIRNFDEVFPEARDDRTVVVPRRGRARGVEFTIENRTGPRFGWSMSYAWARSEELVGARWVPRLRDQTHSFYSDMTYVPAKNWQLSCSWQYHTGWPVTDVAYPIVRLNDGRSIYLWSYGDMGTRRSSDYHRLDLRATRTYHLRHGTLRLFVDIWNAYDRRNECGYGNPESSRVDGFLVLKKKPLYMFPILPSAGVSWEF